MRDAVVADGDLILPDAKHLDLVGKRIVDGLDGIDVGRHRHRESLLHEGRRLAPFGRRDQIEGADLIVLAPAPPIGELFLPAFVFRFADHRGWRGFRRQLLPCGECRNRQYQQTPR